MIGDINVGPHVHAIAVQGDGKGLFTTSERDKTLRIFATSTGQLLSEIKFTGRPNQSAVTPDGKYLAVPIRDGTAWIPCMWLSVTSTASQLWISLKGEWCAGWRCTPSIPSPMSIPTSPINTLTHGLALSPDERDLWVTSLLDDALYDYEVKSQKILARVPTGSGPNCVAFTPDGKYVCVSNAGSDGVSIIDARARREAARLKVGRVPKRLVGGQRANLSLSATIGLEVMLWSPNKRTHGR